MDCNERNFEFLVSVNAYAKDDVEFLVPEFVLNKYLRSSDVVEHEEKAIPISFDKKTFKSSESVQDNLNGTYYKTSFNWEITRPSDSDIETIKSITGKPHHLKFTFFGGSVMWLRAVEDGWIGGYIQDSESFRVELSAVNRSGLQIVM